MKKFIRRLGAIAIALMVGALGASAQSWTGNAPQAGDFYLYNVGSGKFLTSGNWWGTHAALDYDGMQLTLAATDGGYTISTAIAFAGKYLGVDAYMDQAAATWVFTPVSGSNMYTLKTGDKYLVCTGDFVADNTTTAPTTNAGYWQLVTRQQLIDNLKNATPSAPIEASFYMTNPKVRYGWPQSIKGDGLSDNGSFQAGVAGLYNGGCASYGQYRKTFDTYQALTGVMNGQYQVTVKGHYRNQGGGYAIPYMYANDQTTNLKLKGDIGGDNKENATRSLVDDTYLTDAVTVTVLDGNLRVGVKSNANIDWCTWREFTIKLLSPTVDAVSETMPTSAVTTDKWYAINVPTTDDYEITSSAVATLTYTQEGTQLVSTATGTNETFTAGQTKTIHLSAGTVYIKSTAASTISVSYKYNIGTATSSHAYVQGGETVTISWASATTNDPGATFAKNDNPTITFGGNAVNVTPTSNGFTFTVPTVTAGQSYTLSIPADAFGYAAGSTYNAAQSININTPALFDGTYFLKVAATTTDLTTKSTSTGTVGKYLARGAAWGTHATVDTYGLPIIISTNKYNLSTLQVDDTKRYYHANTASDNGYDLWADQGTDNFVFATNQGLLTISSASNTSVYFKHNDTWPEGEYPSVYFDGTGNNGGPIILWEAETVATHAANMTALKNAQAAAAAAAAYADDASTYASLNGITNVADMETAVATLPYSNVVVGGNAPTTVSEKYEGGNPNPAPETVYSNTLAIPAPGLYRFSMQAFYRAANNANTQAMHTAGTDLPPVVLFMGDAETQIKSLYDEEGGTSAYVSGNDAQYNGMYYANNMDAALMMFQEGKYKNDVWFYATAAGTYTYGVKYMGYANNNAQWFIYSPEAVTVTYYGVDDSYFDKLKTEIDKATAINSYYNNASLTSEIATAQAMYDAYTAKQTQVNNEIADLQALYPTSISISNGNFDTDPVYRANGTTSSATQTVSSNGNLYEVTGFSNSGSGNEWVYGLTAEYGTALQLNGVTPPAKNIYGEATGAALGLSAGWSHNTIYSQNLTINSGRYLLYYEYYNQNSGHTTISKNLIGLEETYSTKTSDFTYGEWGIDCFTIDIYENGTYTLNVGISGEGSSNDKAKLWIDNVELYRLGDAVGSVNTDGAIVTVLGEKALSDINAALTSDISVLNLEKATGLTSATISTANNPNLLIYAKAAGQVSNINNVVVNGTCTTLSLSDGHPFVVPTSFTATNARYTLSSVADDGTGNKFATLVLPFNATIPTGGTAYALNQGVSIMTEEIRGTAVNSITANQPVLVTAAGAYSGSNVTVPAISVGQTFTNGELVGTYTAMTAIEGSYVLQRHNSRLAFYLVGDTRPTVNPFRAYIRPQAAAANKFSILFDDNEVTAIDAVDADFGSDAEIFTANGTRIHALRRGLNIVKMSDGTVRKVMVK